MYKMQEYAKVPKIVFLVPYRNRETHYTFFKEQMKMVLSDMNPDDYKIMYCHQCDDRPFNRGAMKNIGFLAIKSKYPTDYQNITLVFNDVDTMPRNKGLLNYQTCRGTVKHFYGFIYALGGIVSITAGDFEMMNGFPNFWGWGYEDNALQQRVSNARLTIDRSNFHPINNTAIIHDTSDPIRDVNVGEFRRYMQKTREGIQSIYNLDYTINEETGFIDITQFSTDQEPDMSKHRDYDLKNGTRPFETKIGLMINRGRYAGARMGMFR
jgi:hypothetical protein